MATILVFLPGESLGQRSPAGYSPRGCKESDTTEATQHGWNLNYLLEALTGFPGSSVEKKLLAKQETGVQSLGWEDPLEKNI